MPVATSETLRSVIDAGRSSRRLDELSSARVIGKIALQVHAAQQKAGSGKAIGPITPSHITILASGEARLELTQASALGYSAPEQVAGSGADRRSDVFSLGAVLWEALTHQRLFDAMNDAAVRAAVQQREIAAPADVNANIPVELSAICMRALARQPADRYQSLKSMAVEIEEFLEEAGYADNDSKIAMYLATMGSPQPVKRPSISLGVASPAASAPSILQDAPSGGATVNAASVKQGPGANLAAALASAGTSASPAGNPVGNATITGIAPTSAPSVSAASPPTPDPVAPRALGPVGPLGPTTTVIGVPAAPVPEDWQDKPAPFHPPVPSVAPTVPLTPSASTTPTAAISATPTAIAVRTPLPPVLPSSATTPTTPTTPTITIDAKHAEARGSTDVPPGEPSPRKADPRQTLIGAAFIGAKTPAGADTASSIVSTSAAKPGVSADATHEATVVVAPDDAGDAKPAVTVDATPQSAGDDVKQAVAAAASLVDDNRTTLVVDDNRTTLVDGRSPVAAAAAAAIPPSSTTDAVTLVSAATATARAGSQSEVTSVRASSHSDVTASKAHPVDAVSLPGRESKPDLLAGWGWGTGKHDAIAPADYAHADEDIYERPSSRKPLLYVIGAGIGATLLIVLIAFGTGGSKNEKKTAAAKTPTSADPAPAVAPPPAPAPHVESNIAQASRGSDSAAPPAPTPDEIAERQRAEADAAAKAAADAEKLAKEEAKAKAEADAQAKAASEKLAKEEAKAKAEAEKLAKADADKLAKADTKAKADAEKLAKADAKAKAAADAKAKADAEARANPRKPEPRPKTTPKTDARSVANVDAKPAGPTTTKPDAKLDVEGAYRLGLQQFARGDTTGALASLRTSLAGNPNYAPTWRGLGLVFEKLGEKGQAKAAYKKYLLLAPTAGDAEIIRGRLERLGS